MAAAKTVAGLKLVGGAGRWTTEDGRFSLEYQDRWTECDCITDPCQHGDSRMRQYWYWLIWDNQTDDHFDNERGEYETLRDAAQTLARRAT